MKIQFKLIVSLLISITLFQVSFANSNINRGQAFMFLANQISEEIPSSYKYIDLEYSNIPKSGPVYEALQKLVYLDLIKNSSADLRLALDIDLRLFEWLSIKILWLKLSDNTNITNTRDVFITQDDLEAIKEVLAQRNTRSTTLEIENSFGNKWLILNDVYKTLNKAHFDRDTLDQDALIDGAISGLTNSVWDTYTTYFPAVESKDFFDGLEWEYEGIWAYVDMPSPGELIILSPIVWSPSEKAGLKWWDRVTHVDDKTVTPENSLSEVISWIKGPANTTVKLTVQRKWETKPLQIIVTRAKIVLKDIEHKSLSSDTYYIQIKNFGTTVDTDFTQALNEVIKNNNTKKIIFDLRNNPGWYLWEVSNMLSHFVPKGEATAIIDYGSSDRKYISKWYDLIDLNDYEIVLLQNSGSASASEIMIGTMKDYFPKAVVIGEQSFWKWSVQSLKTYNDWSTLKYTSAKWFTGKNKVGIDAVGITPDVLLEFDRDLWENHGVDNQLERAQSY